MICQKVRKRQTKYCISDFFHSIKIIEQERLKTALHGEVDAFNQDMAIFQIMCHITKRNIDFEVGGELAGSSVIIDVVCPFFSKYEDIKKNTKLFSLEFEGERFQIENIDRKNLINNYINITAKRINK